MNRYRPRPAYASTYLPIPPTSWAYPRAIFPNSRGISGPSPSSMPGSRRNFRIPSRVISCSPAMKRAQPCLNWKQGRGNVAFLPRNFFRTWGSSPCSRRFALQGLKKASEIQQRQCRNRPRKPSTPFPDTMCKGSGPWLARLVCLHHADKDGML